ncbi:MAG: DNA-binding response regulator [Blastocatellia bacterium]|nr:MAG: DNA-binding response regulator [Blastocatellia bacterium]
MPESTKPTAILIVDDHALFRESIARLLGREPGFTIVGDCGSVDQALLILRERQVDLVLLDFDLGQWDGLDFMRQARQCGVAAKILVVTAGIEPDEASQLIQAGISGVFLKRDSAGSLAQSIRNIMTGKVSFDQRLFQETITAGGLPVLDPQESRFTRRERQVLSDVFEGLANKEIAAKIGVSESSVKATLHQLFAKTGVRTRAQLVRIALERYKHDL